MSYKSRMNAQRPAWDSPDWPTCSMKGCIGVRLVDEEACLAHVGPRTRKMTLATLHPGADVDLRGTPIDAELLNQLLAALRTEDGPPTLGSVRFECAQFCEEAQLMGAKFLGYANFDRTQFWGDAWFGGVSFRRSARFRGALFRRVVWLDLAQFYEDALFEGALFRQDAWFDHAQFNGTVRFDRARFRQVAKFDRAQFGGLVSFEQARFRSAASFESAEFVGMATFRFAWFCGAAWFYQARFHRLTSFHGAQFRREATFDRVRFGQVQLGPLLAPEGFGLSRAIFEGGTIIEAAGPRLHCIGARFSEGATIRLRFAELILDETLFNGPSVIEFAREPFNGLGTGSVELFDERSLRTAERTRQPRLLSLRRVDVSTLTLSNVNLQACLFEGAHHLDQLRIEGPPSFADTPVGWRLGRVGGQGLPIWHWTRRQTLAEEHRWRAARPLLASPSGRLHPKRAGWYPPTCQIPPWAAKWIGQRVHPLEPEHLASTYRALRKAQEDNKNEPGAADFYYGEMEMRRLGRATPWGEWLVLTLYWLVSGYGLRGLRALACLVAVVVGLAALLQTVGFNDGDPSFRDSAIYAAQTTISLATSSNALTDRLSWAGEALRIILRLVGPLLLGLALLAVRNRVKR
jgi:uncharacterized protein YjbI with pentapeptide repeats